MKSIVAVDKNWGIGKNNDLLFHLPKDMAFFRAETTGKIVVMGSNTLKSFPQGKPLKNRINIVLFPDGEQRDDCIVVNNIQQLFLELKKYNSDDIFVIGGAMFYATMLDYCDTVFVTKVDADGEAQVFYPNLDKKAEWKLDEAKQPVLDSGFMLTFCTYKNSFPKEF